MSPIVTFPLCFWWWWWLPVLPPFQADTDDDRLVAVDVAEAVTPSQEDLNVVTIVTVSSSMKAVTHLNPADIFPTPDICLHSNNYSDRMRSTVSSGAEFRARCRLQCPLTELVDLIRSADTMRLCPGLHRKWVCWETWKLPCWRRDICDSRGRK
jgi:hypothetical protein